MVERELRGCSMIDEGIDEESQRQFPLDNESLEGVARVVEQIRALLPGLNPRQVYISSLVLLALERLPASTAGVDVRYGFLTHNDDGNFGWADIEICSTEFRLISGEHFYDPEVGGDTSSQIAFEAFLGVEESEGSVDDWLAFAEAIWDLNLIEAGDNSDHNEIDWTLD